MCSAKLSNEVKYKNCKRNAFKHFLIYLNTMLKGLYKSMKTFVERVVIAIIILYVLIILLGRSGVIKRYRKELCFYLLESVLKTQHRNVFYRLGVRTLNTELKKIPSLGELSLYCSKIKFERWLLSGKRERTILSQRGKELQIYALCYLS
jgi:hypothetical protein